MKRSLHWFLLRADDYRRLEAALKIHGSEGLQQRGQHPHEAEAAQRAIQTNWRNAAIIVCPWWRSTAI